MKHLNTRVCECGHEMTIYDKTAPLVAVTMKNFFGGNVKAFADAACPDCENKYKLYLRQHKNAWQVVALEPVGEPEAVEDKLPDDTIDPDDPPVDVPDPDDENTKNQEVSNTPVDPASLGDEFDAMEREDLKAYLDGLGVDYTANWGDKRLRELCRSAVAAKEGEE